MLLFSKIQWLLQCKNKNNVLQRMLLQTDLGSILNEYHYRYSMPYIVSMYFKGLTALSWGEKYIPILSIHLSWLFWFRLQIYIYIIKKNPATVKLNTQMSDRIHSDDKEWTAMEKNKEMDEWAGKMDHAQVEQVW